MEFGIHKDKSRQFFSHNSFHRVDTRDKQPIGKEYKSKDAKIDGALDAVREAQRYRNNVLAIAPSGSRSVDAYAGPDVFPKPLARSAAQIRWAREPSPLLDQRFDVNEGLVYMLQLLTSRRNEASEVDDLLQRVVIRMGGRGQPGPITPNDQLLLWEILAEDMTALLPLPSEHVKRPPLRPVAEEVKKRALSRAGFRCSFPNCSVPLGENGIGEIAHISSLSPGGPRYDRDLPQEEFHTLDNLVVLCPTHHRLVDGNPDEYTAQIIRSWNDAQKQEDPVFNADNLFTLVRLIMNLMP